MDQDLKTILDSRVPTPTLNKWCSNFAETQQYAADHGVPLIAVVSKDGCGNCKTMESSFLNDTYKNWMASSGLVFYFGYTGDKSADSKDAKKFVQNGDFMPMARIQWSDKGQIKVDVRYYGKMLKKNAAKLVEKFSNAVSEYSPRPAEPEKYSITFDPNGGTLTSGMTRSVNKDALIGQLPVPARSGYMFDGWFTEASGGTQINATTTITEDATYYAHWTVTPAPPIDGPGSGTTPTPPSGRALETMFGLCRDCTIITKDNKVLQYSAAAQTISLVGDYNPAEFLAVTAKIT